MATGFNKRNKGPEKEFYLSKFFSPVLEAEKHFLPDMISVRESPNIE